MTRFDTHGNPDGCLDFGEFFALMTSPAFNGIAEPTHLNRVHEDMSRPLAHYFVSSTHNTYLTGNQLTSDSSADAVAAVLKAGARVVELDCHDGKDGQPSVFHGGTRTKAVSFRECVKAVAEFAFESSEFPVVLTLEIHCGHEQQKVQASILREELGHTLYVPSRAVGVGGKAQEFLSPGLLKKKVLIRYKPKKFDKAANKLKKAETAIAKKTNEVDRLREQLDNLDKQESEHHDQVVKLDAKKRRQTKFLADAEEALKAKKTTLAHQKHVVRHEIKREQSTRFQDDKDLFSADGGELFDTDEHPLSQEMHKDEENGEHEEHDNHHDDDIYSSSDDDEEKDEDAKAEGPKQNKKDDVYDCVPELLELVYVQNRKFKPSLMELEWHENQARATAKRVGGDTHKHVLGASSHSFSEKKLVKVASGKAKFGHAPGGGALQQKSALQDYSQRHLLRVFPAGSRLFSSNYDPQEAWECGCQVVALNYQTKNRAVWIDRGKFSANGGCGWVTKPQWMLGPADGEAGENTTPPGMKLVFTVIGGHRLPKPPGRDAESEHFDPYVCIELSGSLADSSPATKVDEDHHQKTKVQTKVVQDNDTNPYWGQTFEFHLLRPELATMLIVVRDHRVMGHDMMQPDFIGQYAFPIASIREGYRVLPLRDKQGVVRPESSLMVRVQSSPL
jgi:phosphatidylinositol phospholipase C eta